MKPKNYSFGNGANKILSTLSPRQLVVKLRSHNIQKHKHIAEEASIDNNWEVAIEQWNTLIKKYPKHIDADTWIKLNRAYRNLKDFSKAESTILQGIQYKPENLGLKIELAEIFMAQSDWQKAIKQWDLLLKKYHNKLPYYCFIKLAKSHRFQMNYSEAKMVINSVLQTDPDNFLFIAELAEIFMAQSDWQKAATQWRAAAENGSNKTLKLKYLEQEAVAIKNLNDQKKRKILLSKPTGNELVLDASKYKLAQLDYGELVLRLNKINNESIDWKQLSIKVLEPDLVSIIVLVYNNLRLTKRCIESIYKTKNNSAFEVIVFDNGSDSETITGLRAICRKYPDMKLILSTQNLNFALGNNFAFSYSNGTTCIFLNNDTFVTDFWLDGLTKALDRKGVVAAQPTLLYPDNTIQCAGVVFSKMSPIGYPLYAGHKKDFDVMKSRYLSSITAACLTIKAKTFISIKGFDPTYINGQEDVDLCFRLSQNQHNKFYCTKNSVVYHDEGKSYGRGKYVYQNRQTFVKRWGSKISPDDEKYYNEDGFKIKSWTIDSKTNIASGIGSYRPTLMKK